MAVQLVYSGKLAGTSFSPAKENLQKLADSLRKDIEENGASISVELVHDPANPYDKNALKVICNGIFVGHVPRSWNDRILDIGLEKVKASFERFNVHPQSEKIVGAAIEVVMR